MTDDLFGFVRARLDEATAAADALDAELKRHGWSGRPLADRRWAGPAQRILRNAVLAQEIVESHGRLPSTPTSLDQAVLVAAAWRQAVAAVALAWAGHDDYQPRWSPDA